MSRPWFFAIGLVVGTFLTAAIVWHSKRPTAALPPGLPAPDRQPLRPAKQPSSPKPSKPGVESLAPIKFTDITDSLGIDFVSLSGSTKEKEFPTANGQGVALLDYDQDGWLDLFFPNCCRLDQPVPGPPSAMFRNRFAERFERVSDMSCSDAMGYTQGVTAADFDNDGFPDLYLTQYGPNILLQNNGDGTFQNRTDYSGLGDPRWGTSAAAIDYDEDGALDLYVTNYGQWDLNWHREHFCGREHPPVRIYCNPKILTPEVHALYHSLGDGRFVDVATELGIARTDGRGQGVVAADLNNDGHTDLYVANDLSPNFLFINTGRGGFQDHTDTSGAAYNENGVMEASMGADAGDTDGDGLPELFVTNFYNEHNTLYRNLGNNLFQDVSNWTGVAAGSLQFVGWGTALEDLDGDGWLDILVVNGHVDDNVSELGRDEPYAQKTAVWRNQGKGQFEKLEGCGAYFDTAHVSRGAAFGDLDNDGDIDVVITHKEERPTVLRNDSPNLRPSPSKTWIQLKLVGTRSNREALGAQVEVVGRNGTIVRQVRGGVSYLSSHDRRLTVGLGDLPRLDKITIRWPSGIVTVLEDMEVNRSYTVREPFVSASESVEMSPEPEN